jgi:hypothetical protein
VVSSPPANVEIGAKGREIAFRQGTYTVLAFKEFKDLYKYINKMIIYIIMFGSSYLH